MGYPLIVKQPDSSSSLGVFKADNLGDLQAQLDALFKISDLLLLQEFIPTEFDWRIGVLDRRAIYACRYDMVRNHWQIYDHTRKRGSSGDSVTLPTFEVPRPVLDAAVKACRVVGDGLYGVDLKQTDKGFGGAVRFADGAGEAAVIPVEQVAPHFAQCAGEVPHQLLDGNAMQRGYFPGIGRQLPSGPAPDHHRGDGETRAGGEIVQAPHDAVGG